MLVTLDKARAVVASIQEQGYATVPIVGAETVVEETQQAFDPFLKRRIDQGDYSKWSIRAPGERKADLGIIHSTREGKDWKWFFHDNCLLRPALRERQIWLSDADETFLSQSEKLFAYACALGAVIAEAFEEQIGGNLLSAYKESCRIAMPYNTSTLRSLYYPAGELDGRVQRGAKTHIDRSLFTIHFGDVGGSLLALQDRNDETGVPVSPPPGHALVFPGVKILWPSSGRWRPLWHKSVTIPGQDRAAFVFFAHVLVPGYQVIDANQTLSDWHLYHRPDDVGC